MGNIKHYHGYTLRTIDHCNRSFQADAGKSSEVTRLHPQSDGNCANNATVLERYLTNDPVLRNIAMTLRNGLQAGRADNPVYGESLSKALAFVTRLPSAQRERSERGHGDASLNAVFLLVEHS